MLTGGPSCHRHGCQLLLATKLGTSRPLLLTCCRQKRKDSGSCGLLPLPLENLTTPCSKVLARSLPKNLLLLPSPSRPPRLLQGMGSTSGPSACSLPQERLWFVVFLGLWRGGVCYPGNRGWLPPSLQKNRRVASEASAFSLASIGYGLGLEGPVSKLGSQNTRPVVSPLVWGARLCSQSGEDRWRQKYLP